jgi:hypothetical protein
LDYTEVEWVAEFNPISATIKRQQDNAGSWTIQVPYTDPNSQYLTTYARLHLFVDGVEVMFGFIDDVQITMSDDKIVYEVSGLGEVETLSHTEGMRLAIFTNTPTLAILDGILNWAGWALGDTSTMVDPTVTSSINMYDEETAFQQISRLCSTIPQLHWRWGGYNCMGKPMLDVGFFDEVDTTIRLDQSADVIQAPSSTIGQIVSASIRHTFANLVSEIHARGGKFNPDSAPDEVRYLVTSNINSYFALYPAEEDPDYTIESFGSTATFHRIRNNKIYPAGRIIHQTWSDIAPRLGEDASASDVAEAAGSLYRMCKRYLQEHETTDPAYQFTIAGLNTMLPLPGDRIRIDANVLTQSVSGFGLVPLDGESLHDDYRIISWDASFSGDKLTFTLTATEQEFIGNYGADDEANAIADVSAQVSRVSRIDDEALAIFDISSTTAVLGPGLAANASLCEDTDARSIGFVFTPDVSWDYIFPVGIAVTPAVPYDYEITQYPVPTPLPGLPAIISFRFRDHPWNALDVVQITMYTKVGY